MARLRSKESRDALKKMRQAWVDRLPKAINAEMRAAVEESAEMVARGMRAIAPVAEKNGGELRASIAVTMDNQALKATITAGDRKAFYARWVEFGTRRTAAQPFFYPIWRARKKDIKRRLAAAFRKAFKKIGGVPQ